MHDAAYSCSIRQMLTDERRALILDRLRSHGRVLAADLTAELDVSSDTIRRDLRELDDAGLLRRVHGGALPRHGDAAPFEARARRAPEAKASIARRAAECVRDGQLVVLDGGTTTLEVARALLDKPQLRARVTTTSPPIALVLADHPGLEVTVVGGTLRPHSARDRRCPGGRGVASDPRGRRFPRRLRTAPRDRRDHLGPRGAPRQGRDARGRSRGDRARRPRQARHRAVVIVAPLSAVTCLVTDTDADDVALAPYRALGIDVLRA